MKKFRAFLRHLLDEYGQHLVGIGAGLLFIGAFAGAGLALHFVSSRWGGLGIVALIGVLLVVWLAFVIWGEWRYFDRYYRD